MRYQPMALTPVTYQPTSSLSFGPVLRQIAANLAHAIGFLALQDKILRGEFSLFFDGSHAGCRFHPRCEHATPRCGRNRHRHQWRSHLAMSKPPTQWGVP
jgi:hypothetical protein